MAYYPDLNTVTLAGSPYIGGGNLIPFVQQPSYGAATPSYSVVPYEMQSAIVPYSAPVAGPMVAYAPAPVAVPQQQHWLYDGEYDTTAAMVAGHKGPKPKGAPRKYLYRGSLHLPMLEEAYLSAHLSQQAELSHFGSPGESIQFNSSTGRTNILTVVGNSADTNDAGWRVLSDSHTNYVVFRGSQDWRYPAFTSRQTEITLGPGHSMLLHSHFLTAIGPHYPELVNVLTSHQKSRIVLTGHGNGGALALVFYFLLQRAGFSRKSVVVYTFGAPFVGSNNSNSSVRQPFPRHFREQIHNFVNESDIVPLLLGAKDFASVDKVIGRDNNPFKSGQHLVSDIKNYKPIGRYYHVSKYGELTDIPEGRELHFLTADREPGTLQQRLYVHSPEQYVAKLRKVTNDN
jgi:hypothetical protein